MNDSLNPLKNVEKTEKNDGNNQFLEHGIFIKDDDQDWGSSGMNDIQKDTE